MDSGQQPAGMTEGDGGGMMEGEGSRHDGYRLCFVMPAALWQASPIAEWTSRKIPATNLPQ
jgi:hypothetical protein